MAAMELATTSEAVTTVAGALALTTGHRGGRGGKGGGGGGCGGGADGGGLRGVDVELLWRTLMVSFNVESVTPPANGGCIGVPAACPVGLMSAGGRVRTW